MLGTGRRSDFLNLSGSVSGGPLVADPVPEPAIAEAEEAPDYSFDEEEEAPRADAPCLRRRLALLLSLRLRPSPAKAKAKEAAAKAAAVKEEMIDDFIARIEGEASAKAARRALQAGRPSSSAAPPESSARKRSRDGGIHC